MVVGLQTIYVKFVIRHTLLNMNMPSTQIKVFQIKENIQAIASFWASLYKVYAHIDIDNTNKSASVDVIDGYLNAGEELNLLAISNLTEQKIKHISIGIVQKTKKNTYFRVGPMDFNLNETTHVLVCVYRENQIIGYQYFDTQNNILGEPKFVSNKLIANK